MMYRCVTDLVSASCSTSRKMLSSAELLKFLMSTIRKIVVFLIAAALFALFVSVGSWASAQISKRQFETEARNIVAVLRSGVSVTDGLITSLGASDYTVSDDAGNDKLTSHLATVLAKYDYVAGIGRFDKIVDVSDATGTDDIWQYDQSGTREPIQAGSTRQSLYPLTTARFSSASTLDDLTGFDLASVPTVKLEIENRLSSGQSIIVAPPEHLQRSGHLWVFLSNAAGADGDASDTGGYLLEVDIEEMASSGGVTFDSFGLSLSKFAVQGEFESDARADSLYHRQAGSKQNNSTARASFLSKWMGEHRLISSIEIGGKTLIMEVWKDSDLSSRVGLFLTAIGLWLALMFLAIVDQHGKRRAAQKLQRLESQRLYSSQHRAAVTLASIGDAVITTDVANTVLYANGAAESLLGYSLDQMQGRVLDQIVVPVSRRKSYNKSLVIQSADGSEVYVDKKESVLKHSDGELSGKVTVLRDVSVEHKLTEELQHKVNHDSLTGLSNRFNFEQQMEALFECEIAKKQRHAVCFIDLDRFKEVNDTCGHAAGDELLIQIAGAFEDNVRGTDLVARLGGDEFGIVLRNCAKADALQVANRIKEYFQSFYFEYSGHVFPVRCSIGIVDFEPSETDLNSVIKGADTACFDAKKQGRNSICEGDLNQLSSSTESEAQWLPKIKDAIENNRFHLCVQSIASLSDGLVNRHEILLRMVEDNGEHINAAFFMKTAERYDLSLDIDKWVISRTLEEISKLPVTFEGHQFSINLSKMAIGSDKFIEYLKNKIVLSGVSTSRLCFDIKESDTLNSPVAAAEFCRQLQSIGCTVALDDFGSAMTSLSAIKSIPINMLKIDGSLIAELSRAPSLAVASDVSADGHLVNPDLVLVKAIHSFASSMGLATIAEQVDNQDCLDILRMLEIDFVQGYGISKPQPFEEFVSDAGGSNLRAA